MRAWPTGTQARQHMSHIRNTILQVLQAAAHGVMLLRNHAAHVLLLMPQRPSHTDPGLVITRRIRGGGLDST
jgi:hypothetical protein